MFCFVLLPVLVAFHLLFSDPRSHPGSHTAPALQSLLHSSTGVPSSGASTTPVHLKSTGRRPWKMSPYCLFNSGVSNMDQVGCNSPSSETETHTLSCFSEHGPCNLSQIPKSSATSPRLRPTALVMAPCRDV